MYRARICMYAKNGGKYICSAEKANEPDKKRDRERERTMKSNESFQPKILLQSEEQQESLCLIRIAH